MMKKTVSVNLNGQVFTIDEDAYNKLHSYLIAIAAQFENTEESKEIISDIEARIAELFSEYITTAKQSITIDEVNNVIGIMGMPNDFANESKDQKSTFENSENRFKKRLYRDPENRVIGGVASGIGAWLEIDPVVVRILFVISFFIFGPLLYFILWIVIPLARTPSQRLEMRGEEVNLNNIEKIIKEEFRQVKHSFKSYKKKQNRQKIEDELSNSFGGIARIFMLFGKIVMGFVLAIFMFIFMLFLGFMTHIIPLNIITTHCNSAAPFSNFIHVFISQSSSILLFWGILFFVGTILLSIIVNIVKVITGNYRRWWFINAIFTFLTFLGLALIIISIVKEAEHFNVSTETEMRSNIPFQKNDTISIEMTIAPLISESTDEKNWNYNNNGDFSFTISSTKCHFIKGNLSLYSTPKLNIEQSKNDSLYIVIKKKANGLNHQEAVSNCEKINYSWSVDRKTVRIDPYFTLSNVKWRNQQLEITINIPHGMTVKLGKGISQCNNELKEDHIYTMNNNEFE